MRETERRTDMTTHIVETDAEKAARAAAKVAYENIQKARHALYVAHRDCCAPVPIPVVGGDYVTPSNRRDLARLLNGTILHTPNGLYVKHWKWWRGEYEKISHKEMWERILGGYADRPLDDDFLLTPREEVAP